MSTSRRTFFKGLVGGVGALSLGSVILSQRGWFGFVGPAEAAKIPRSPKYYKLQEGYTFFEGYKIGEDPPNMLPLFKKERALYPEHRQSVKTMKGDRYKPQIIKHKEKGKKETHILNEEAAYITRMLLMEVDLDTLASMYASRFNVENAKKVIEMFMDTVKCFEENKAITAKKQSDTPNQKAQDFDYIWADFSTGSGFPIFQLLKPI